MGVDLHLDLGAGGNRRSRVEQALRDAIRSGRLAPGARLPSTRALAAELSLARNTVAAAYEQLIAEGYLAARPGSGTTVAAQAAPPVPVARPAALPAPRLDLRPGSPDVTTFPVEAWIRATRRALSRAPASVYDYGDPQGRPELRTALATYLGRTRGVLADPDHIVICSGYVQALSLLSGVIGGAIAMEDPCLPFHREIVRHAGADVVALPVDSDGARTDLLTGAVRAAVLTPAHQYPIGVTLQPARRHAAVAWARDHGGLLIEDDYDGEFRYDRQPVGTLQGMAPGQVAYIGTAAKSLGPGLRLAWMVLPGPLVEPVSHAKRLSDLHTESIGQLALADLITTHTYDRHIRTRRLAYRRRRDLLADRIGSRHHLLGIAAGLHALLQLPGDGPSEDEIATRAAADGLALTTLGPHRHTPATTGMQGLVLGYATPRQAGYLAALDVLARTLVVGGAAPAVPPM
ncbi:PLP-dependent aminotransferase family protein [Winogradskya consettensis]|uniref:GntR family transcriptional regulator n=1 Tax=Winogradskya consettensis TaxID=113560 RepID=A0A919VRM6_9ACTN|nr:PLP-dependent aminotransferase family protein [Actinoplanes consettensis]GIM76224.1 GntR family transcriptional regulator [Actinoplanes consettensis]